MRDIVRDDIIGLDCYVDAKFKYNDYLEIIYGAGGYCFLEQFDRLLSKEGGPGGSYIARKMEEANLIKTEYFSNYKYVVLTSNALKYLYYRYDASDFSEIPKNKIPIRNLASKPSEKVLFTSAMYVEIVMNGSKYTKGRYNYTLFLKQNHIDYLKEFKIDNDILIKNNKKVIDQLLIQLEIIDLVLENTLEVYKNIEKEREFLSSAKSEKEVEINYIKENKKIFRNNQKDIESLETDLSLYKNINDLNNNSIKHIKFIQDKRNSVVREINEIQNSIEILESDQEKHNEKADVVIRHILNMRDISKVICVYSRNILSFSSVFVKNHKSNYDKIINDTIRLFKKELDIDITEVELNLYSIKESEGYIKKLNKNLRTELIRKISINYEPVEVKYTTNYIVLTDLQKYFDRVSNDLNYIKKPDVDTFEELRDKLSSK